MAMTYKWRVYLHGLASALISSVSSTVTVALVDPSSFNPFAGGEWSKIAALVIVSALLGFFTYTKQHPLPDPDKDIDAMSAAREQIAAIREGTGGGGPRVL